MGLKFQNVEGVTTITDDIQRLGNIGDGKNPYDAVNLSQLNAVIAALTENYPFETVAAQAAYTVPAGMTIILVTMGSEIVASSNYTYAGTTFTFTYPPDDVYDTVIFYK